MFLLPSSPALDDWNSRGSVDNDTYDDDDDLWDDDDDDFVYLWIEFEYRARSLDSRSQK